MSWPLTKSPYFYLGALADQDQEVVNTLNPPPPPILIDDSEGVEE